MARPEQSSLSMFRNSWLNDSNFGSFQTMSGKVQRWLRILLRVRAMRQRGSFSSKKSCSGCAREGPGDAAGGIVSVTPMKQEFPGRFNWYPQGGGEKD